MTSRRKFLWLCLSRAGVLLIAVGLCPRAFVNASEEQAYRVARSAISSRNPNPADWIEAALSLGASSEPRPYILRAPRGRWPVGLLYTPFVRVAVAARHAADRGETLLASEVPAELLEPVVYAYFHRVQSPFSREADAAGVPSQFSVVPSDQGGPEWPRIDPVWVREASALGPELREILRLAVDSKPRRDYHPVAAFPVEVVRPGNDFAVYQKWRGSDGWDRLWQLRANITEVDVREWR